ncbi:MAG: 30S ribosome-binding factor RbfA [Planctomycetota bacterium]|nr:30S ribosome-binding factor RbfA [Planctomycetota bacterium]
MSRRTEQVASILHRAVQSVISEGLSDPRIEGVITITGVRVTDDFAHALVSVSVLPARNESRVIHGLNDAAGFIRRQAGERVSLHHPPRLLFKLDRSSKREAWVLSTLADIRETEGFGAPESDEKPEGADASAGAHDEQTDDGSGPDIKTNRPESPE